MSSHVMLLEQWKEELSSETKFILNEVMLAPTAGCSLLPLLDAVCSHCWMDDVVDDSTSPL